ncbi:fungal-specific transcription factor domain-containing protein [Coprinopsis sp. MPI-PUGE-AT-0042]|nr:fungal-specific transcription factor domain-containing protein [Coprinopsis sp. MPI-PUGE-AT-0042]
MSLQFEYFPDFTMARQDQGPSQGGHNSASPSMPIDPGLGMYPPPYYQGYPQGQDHQQRHQQPPLHPQDQHLLSHHMSGSMNYSSPSSQASEAISTPPMDSMYASSSHGKRPSSTSLASDSRKKQKRSDESDTAQSPSAEKDEPKPKPTRGSRACTVCRRLKMKCVGAEQGPPCKRCISGNHECIFEESNRGKRSSKKHELLSRSLRKMEKTLDTVLRSIGNPSIVSGMVSRSPSPDAQGHSAQDLISSTPSPSPQASSYPAHHVSPGSPKLHSLPDNALNPLGLLAEASLANRRPIAPKNDSAETPQVGVASNNYFKPGPMTILPLRRLFIERQIQPEMLNFVTTEEVVALFNIYFDNIHTHCNLLDRNFHTPSLVCSRSPFLLTTICSIASKFYTAKPELHPRLTELAKRLAFSVPAKGYKSVEIVQAYLLLALWGCGAVERYEQDKTWMLLGMAIRMGTDLNLHRKTAVKSSDTAEGKARDLEVHNRERTWIMCFCLDRSFSAQMGKPNSIKEDYIIRNATRWYQSPVANPSDASLVAYAELQRILARSLDFLYSGTESVSGLQTQCDYLLVIKTFESQLYDWRQQWYTERMWANETSKAIKYKKTVSQFYFNYAMLVLNSFGLQNALERVPLNVGHFFARCHTSAIACATIIRDDLGPSGFLKYSPDSHFVQISYAVLSLLKLIRPEFQAFLDNEQATLQLVKDVADLLDNIAANPLHTPALYSGFLRALISAKLEPLSNQSGASKDQPPPGTDDSQHASGSTPAPNRGDMHPPNAYSQPPAPQQQQQQHMNPFGDPNVFGLNEFQFESEMGPVADISTFPPTMAPVPSEDAMGVMTMENILSSGFWDSMLVPGYNSLDGFSGGFVFGAGGSGLITPRFGASPMHSGANTPGRNFPMQITQHSINAAFSKNQQMKDSGIAIETPGA